MIEKFHIESCIYNVLLDKYDPRNVKNYYEGLYLINRITAIDDLVCNIVNCVILDDYELISK